MRLHVRSLVLALAVVVADACSGPRGGDAHETAAGEGWVEGSLAGAPQAFDDAAELEAPHDHGSTEYAQIVASLIRAELAGAREGAFLETYKRASEDEKARLRIAAVTALEQPALRDWIDARPELQRAALWLSTSITPPDVAVAENVAVEARLASFKGWDRHPYQVIIVPGFTPLGQREPVPGVHPVARARLEEAVRAHREGLAPFIMVSGGNVHPPGTPYYEGIEMKRALRAMGVSEDVIIVEARARHSTTNLRNAGRFMLAHGMTRALITPPGGGVGVFDQTFYFANPEMSTFYSRCERELGYRVGTLSEAGPARVAFVPSGDVVRRSYRDPLDP